MELWIEMKASVLICTHNRASFLKDLLTCLKDQSYSSCDYELIVVDNASEDQTEFVVRDIAKEMKNLSYVCEPKLGLSAARNTGIQNTRGDIIAFLDDDSLPESTWLETLIRSFEEFSPAPVCVGGKILPIWEVSKPDWLPNDSRLQILSLLDWGDFPTWRSSPSLFAGNLAIKKSALHRIGGFNTQLGRKGDMLFSMEEIFFLFMVLQEYGKQSLLYQPKALVYHRITEEKIADKGYILRRSYWDGYSKAIMKIAISRMDFKEKRNASWLQLAEYGKLGSLAESVKKLIFSTILGILSVVNGDRKLVTESILNMAFGMGGVIGLSKHVLFGSINE